jgi:hypothetical protein
MMKQRASCELDRCLILYSFLYLQQAEINLTIHDMPALMYYNSIKTNTSILGKLWM